MSVIAPDFKLSGFIKSIINDAVWFLLIFSLIGFPVIMMVLFFIPRPVIDGELLTPFLACTYLADPTRTLPIVQAFMTTDMFKIMAFPGFGFAALLAAGTIFVERKMLAKLQLRVGPFYCGKVEPYRLKLSVGSFRNLIALPYLLKGEKLGNMPSVYWSLNYWPVEADR